MELSRIIPQLRTTDLAAAIEFYTAKVGFEVEFVHGDFYAAVRQGEFVVHLKQVDIPDPSVAFVDGGDHLHLYFETPDVSAVAAELKQKGVSLVRELHETAWGTRECVVRDPDGHTLYFGQRLT